MFRFLFVLFLSVNFVFGQTVYQAHEVSKVAEPQGGKDYLLLFIGANLQIPFQARLKNITGKVFVSGIVEIDGTMSDLKVVRSLHPLCDKEALRIMGLYKAWTPAQKDSQPVKQVTVFPVLFPDTPVLNYDSTSHSTTQYFDKFFKPTTNPDKYAHQFVVPLDETGFVAGDVIFTDLKTEKSRVIAPYESKKEIRRFYNNASNIDSAEVFTVSALGNDNVHYAPVVTQKTDGTVIAYKLMNTITEPSIALNYFPNGLLQNKYETVEGGKIETSWYQNGQVEQLKESYKKESAEISKTYITSFWDKTGKQLVKDGNGWLSQNIGQQTDNYKQGGLTEQGEVRDGLKVGKWTGKWSDSTLFYEEIYKDGEIKEAFAIHDGQKVPYTKAGEQAEFKGGTSALLQFLGQNITYPRQASRMNISGKVYLTFVINTLGEVQNIVLVKGIGGGCNEEAMRVIRNTTGRWKPGFMRGKAINVKYDLPISFVLE